MYEAFCLAQYFGLLLVSSCVLCFGFSFLIVTLSFATAGCAFGFAFGFRAGADDVVDLPSWNAPVCSGGGDNVGGSSG